MGLKPLPRLRLRAITTEDANPTDHQNTASTRGLFLYYKHVVTIQQVHAKMCERLQSGLFALFQAAFGLPIAFQQV